MGLSPEFKKFLRERIPTSLEAEARADVVFVDAMCVLHSFMGGSADTLVNRIIDAGAPLVNQGGTLVVVFDRQSTSPVQKHKTQQKRRRVVHDWSIEELSHLLDTRELPNGEGWMDLLACRDVRYHVVDFLTREIFARLGLMASVEQLIIHNGRREGPAQMMRRGAPLVEAPPEFPTHGEADVAIPAIARFLGMESVTVVTVDTDLIPLMMVHGGPKCSVALMHADQRHRICVDVNVLSTELQKKPYGLSRSDFVIVAASKGTDFSPKCYSRLPDWHETLLSAGSTLKAAPSPLLDATTNELSRAAFNRMVRGVVQVAGVGKKRGPETVRLSENDLLNIEFVTKYWLQLL